MANNNQNTNQEQPPKINMQGTENGAPAKVPPPARPFLTSTIQADSEAVKKQTSRIDLSSAIPIPKGVAPHDENFLKKKTTQADDRSGITPISEEDKNEVAKKSTIRIDTSEIVPLPQEDRNEAAKKSTVRVQIDEDRAKGDTTRLDAQSSEGAEEAAKKRTARIDLKEVLDESDDIFKRRTARLDAANLAGAAEAPGIPRTVRIKRPDTPPTAGPRKPMPVSEEKTAVISAPAKESEATSRKSETSRIDLPPEVAEQPPTRRKTIRIKRPEGIVSSRPLEIGRTRSLARPSGPMAIPKEEEAGALFSVMALVAILINVTLITIQSLTLRSFLQF